MLPVCSKDPTQNTERADRNITWSTLLSRWRYWFCANSTPLPLLPWYSCVHFPPRLLTNYPPSPFPFIGFHAKFSPYFPPSPSISFGKAGCINYMYRITNVVQHVWSLFNSTRVLVGGVFTHNSIPYVCTYVCGGFSLKTGVFTFGKTTSQFDELCLN